MSNRQVTSKTEVLFWNRDESQRRQYNARAPILKECKILSLSDPNDDANWPLHGAKVLPDGATLLQIGTCLEDFDPISLESANTIFCSHTLSREPLAQLLSKCPRLEWIHTRSAGIDFISSPALARWTGQLTNAKGQFSSTLGEYTLMACAFFAKDLPRLRRQQRNKDWNKYSVQELRGATLGIVGYGDIGRAAAKLAKVYGMRIVALRRRPERSEADEMVDRVYGSHDLNKLFAESDYILCSAPLTAETKGLIGREQFLAAKSDAVFINVGRGPIVDEQALIEALQSGQLKGAALDVFATEPLPIDSPLWEMDQVLLSPHNMDQTETFMHESTEFFVHEQIPRFVRGEPLLNPVNAAAGY